MPCLTEPLMSQCQVGWQAACPGAFAIKAALSKLFGGCTNLIEPLTHAVSVRLPQQLHLTITTLWSVVILAIGSISCETVPSRRNGTEKQKQTRPGTHSTRDEVSRSSPERRSRKQIAWYYHIGIPCRAWRDFCSWTATSGNVSRRRSR